MYQHQGVHHLGIDCVTLVNHDKHRQKGTAPERPKHGFPQHLDRISYKRLSAEYQHGNEVECGVDRQHESLFLAIKHPY